MKKILYILFSLTLLASCSKTDFLEPASNGPSNNPFGITDPDKDGDHDTDSGGGITDPDKDGDHDQDAEKSSETIIN